MDNLRPHSDTDSDQEKALDHAELRHLIETALQAQGFAIQESRMEAPELSSKDVIRQLHAAAVEHRRELAGRRLARHETGLLTRIAAGNEIDPTKLQPRLVEVLPDTAEELLFRYSSLHWSIPISSGYGRRLRFLVVDDQNDKLIGLIGLGDPVFSLRSRDRWIGWCKHDRVARLHHVMDAFVLGAVPPYSYLMCGKLIALLVASNEVRDTFLNKYRGRQTSICNRSLDGILALITTNSALGRSSIYNRLHYKGVHIYSSCGFTQWTGEFHFSNGIYSKIAQFASVNCPATAKHRGWGIGFRNRREVVRKALKELGLPEQWLTHGIGREVFAVALAENTRQFLRGIESTLKPYDLPANRISAWFKDRWLLRRAVSNTEWRRFVPERYRIWSEG